MRRSIGKERLSLGSHCLSALPGETDCGFSRFFTEDFPLIQSAMDSAA